ncbi:hypothetical protein ASG89_06260 [Paenibacillus sp. Soil766]|uniref:hypothetical protein n=1 Tax=Paenibacillus sp. Soil766 TaxID=1736404 RepID=UPI00070CDB46|nr:hypothetical protein [Paenibacillus sp. Soil766]KRE93106.1 hypothetical protein ASG89_06260 [Paenibacillus sp. Soil766]
MRIFRNLLLISLGLIGTYVIYYLIHFMQGDTLSLQRQPSSQYGQTMQVTENRHQLIGFINDKLTSRHGVSTNLQDTDQKSAAASGHEVLSESAGLLMRYYALTGQKDKFDEQWQQAKLVFDTPYGFSYRYSPKQNKQYPMNAIVDDLRIIRALDEASHAFESKSYRMEAEGYGKRVYQYNVVNGQMRDFYDPTYQLTNSFLTLCYIDAASLELIPVSRKKKATLEASMLQIAQEGYLSDSFPFYQTRYDFNSKNYQSEGINTVESLLTILNLAEVKLAQPASIQYIKAQVKSGTLYGQYDRNGKPLNEVRSTAIYAISAMIGSVIKDQELYADSILQMNEFQNHDPQSQLNGGFGDVNAVQAYSFDNLMALLAYSY